MVEKRISVVFAGGGTGGHLFPALVVADALRQRHADAQISFIGAERGIEQRLVPEAGYPLFSLRIAGLKGRGAIAKIRPALAAGWAVVRCLQRFLRHRPGLVVGVGGYASGPAVLAALLLRVPTMILEQNHYPGATNRFLARWVDGACVPSEDARRRLGDRGTVTGNPVRRGFFASGDLPGHATPRLLVFGGSMLPGFNHD